MPDKKRVFIIHGWDGYPEEGWFPWFKKELESRGFHVEVPQMPQAKAPKIETWVPHLSKVVQSPDEKTFFVGHSIGCQAIMRYLEKIDQRIGGVIFVAGFFSLKPEAFEDEEGKAVARPWLESPINFEKVRKNMGSAVAVLSDNDRFVPLENIDSFKKNLDITPMVKPGMGHFSGSEGMKELPLVLEELLRIVV